MNSKQLLSIICFLGGVTLLLYGVSIGEVEVGVFFIMPFLIGSGLTAFIGFLLIMLSFILFFLSRLGEVEIEESLSAKEPLDTREVFEEKPEKKTSFHGGGVVLIGPIPIIFGTNWKITMVMVVLAIILLLILLSLFLLQKP